MHIFGATSSPGCANYGLQHLAEQYQAEFPMAAKFIRRNFYVDDGVISVSDTASAIVLANEVRELCSRGNLHLHKFLSNDRSVMQSIPPAERADDLKGLDLVFDQLPVERALGIHWCVESDQFHFRITLKDQPLTRRGILSTVASLYDPLGFIAPFVLEGKRVLQEMCRRGTGWDDPLPDEMRPRWESWRNDLIHLQNLTIPRFNHPQNFGTVTNVELHHFSDASCVGYGQCSYLRLKDDSGSVHCVLVMGKFRVAPTTLTTIPRLELTAAVVSVKISALLADELEYERLDEYFWTDSEVVLGYISNEARRFHTFVANRVQRIRDRTTPQQWKHVRSEDNPADHASRGLTAEGLQASNWFVGPKFLWESEIAYDKRELVPELAIGDPEVRRVHVLATHAISFCLLERMSRFSSWDKAVRALARLRRIAQKRRNAEDGLTSVKERRDAELLIISEVERSVYSEEIRTMREKTELKSNSRLRGLDPFIDDEGIIRVGGRLQCSSLSFEVRCPIVLPQRGHVTSLIIGHHHAATQH